MSNLQRVATALTLAAAFLAPGTAMAGCKDKARPGVDWHGCNMQMLMLEKTDLAGANLEGAFLSGTAFTGSRLTQANLPRAELVRTSFEKAELSSANLEKALAARAVFNAATLKGSRQSETELRIPWRNERRISGSSGYPHRVLPRGDKV